MAHEQTIAWGSLGRKRHETSQLTCHFGRMIPSRGVDRVANIHTVEMTEQVAIVATRFVLNLHRRHLEVTTQTNSRYIIILILVL